MTAADEPVAWARPEPVGKAALIAQVGGQRGYADWTNPGHRLRRLLAEFLGMAGLTFILSVRSCRWPSVPTSWPGAPWAGRSTARQ